MRELSNIRDLLRSQPEKNRQFVLAPICEGYSVRTQTAGRGGLLFAALQSKCTTRARRAMTTDRNQECVGEL